MTTATTRAPRPSVAPCTSALAVSTDRFVGPAHREAVPAGIPPFNADRAHSATNTCRYDWVEVGSCEFGCPRCGATYSYDTDPAQVRHAANVEPVAWLAAFAGCPAPAWVPSHQVDVLAAAVADAQTGIPQPERICRDAGDQVAYAAHYVMAVKAEAFRMRAAQPLEVATCHR